MKDRYKELSIEIGHSGRLAANACRQSWKGLSAGKPARIRNSKVKVILKGTPLFKEIEERYRN